MSQFTIWEKKDNKFYLYMDSNFKHPFLIDLFGSLKEAEAIIPIDCFDVEYRMDSFKSLDSDIEYDVDLSDLDNVVDYSMLQELD